MKSIKVPIADAPKIAGPGNRASNRYLRTTLTVMALQRALRYAVADQAVALGGCTGGQRGEVERLLQGLEGPNL